MELQVQHENHTIVLWLRSGCRADLSLLYETPHIGLLFLYRKLQKKSGCDKIGDENITAWQTERIGGFATT